jgi:hypothetical protein
MDNFDQNENERPARKVILQSWFDAAKLYTQRGGFTVFLEKTCETLFKVGDGNHSDFMSAYSIFQAMAKKAGHKFPQDPEALAFIEEAILVDDETKWYASRLKEKLSYLMAEAQQASVVSDYYTTKLLTKEWANNFVSQISLQMETHERSIIAHRKIKDLKLTCGE